MDKKGQLGLDTVVKVVSAVLIIGIFAIAMFLAITSFIESGAVSDTKRISVSIINGSTQAAVTGTPAQLTDTFGFTDCTMTVNAAINLTDEVFIESSNYSVVGCTIKTLDPAFNQTAWTISADAEYSVHDSEQDIANNVTGGITDFFANIPTVMTILGAVVIILAVVLIIIAVSRFSGGRL